MCILGSVKLKVFYSEFFVRNPDCIRLFKFIQ